MRSRCVPANAQDSNEHTRSVTLRCCCNVHEPNRASCISLYTELQVFAGSFGGKVLYENPEYINPNAVRSYEKRKAAGVYERRKSKEQAAKDHKEGLKLPIDELSNTAVFAPEKSGAHFTTPLYLLIPVKAAG